MLNIITTVSSKTKSVFTNLCILKARLLKILCDLNLRFNNTKIDNYDITVNTQLQENIYYQHIVFNNELFLLEHCFYNFRELDVYSCRG